jgi:hypothetical protein
MARGVPIEAPSTLADVDLVLQQMIQLTGLLNSVVAERDAAVVAEQGKRQELISDVTAELAERRAALEAWAGQNRAAFGDGNTIEDIPQSLELNHGILRFRKGNRALEVLAGWNWKRVLDRLVRKIAGLLNKLVQAAPYLRIKTEIDKRRILSESAGEAPKLTPAKLRALGVKVVRDEKFSIELKGLPPDPIELKENAEIGQAT